MFGCHVQIVSMRCYALMSSIDIVDSAITNSFLQTVRDQMVLDGRLVDALRGAAMVAVSGQTAVVAAAIDHALSVFFLPLGCSPIQVMTWHQPCPGPVAHSACSTWTG